MSAITPLIPYSRLIGIGLVVSALGYAYYAAYHRGYNVAKAEYDAKVVMAQKKANEIETRNEQISKKVKNDYETKIKSLRARTSPSVVPDDVNAVRVRISCPDIGQEPSTTTRVAEPSPPVAPQEITQSQWEDANFLRFEENRLKLESLQSWVENVIKSNK